MAITGKPIPNLPEAETIENDDWLVVYNDGQTKRAAASMFTGEDATINGVNALTIIAGNNVNLSQNGGTATLSVDLSAKQDKLSVTGAANKGVYVSASGVVSAMTYELNKSVPADAVFTDTWTPMTGATSSTNGAAGYAPLPPSSGYNTKYLRADGTWTIPPDTTYTLTQDANDGHTLTFSGSDGSSATITIPDNAGSTTAGVPMTGATSSANGTAGYVPAPPSDGYNTKYLRADGTWTIPPSSGSTLTPASVAPLMDGTAAIGVSTDYARADHVHPTDTSRASASDVSGLQSDVSALQTVVSQLLSYIQSIDVYRTASGNPATFSDAKADSVMDLRVTWTPTQELVGIPSYEHPLPLTGLSSITITRTGTGGANSQSVSVTLTNGNATMTVYGGTLNLITGILTVTHRNISASDFSGFSGSQSEGGLYIATAPLSATEKPVIPENSLYNDEAISNVFQNGQDSGAQANYENFAIQDGGVSVYTTSASLSAFQAKYSDLQIVYALNTPISYLLAPTQLSTLAGYNSVAANAGSVSVIYKANPTLTLGGN